MSGSFAHYTPGTVQWASWLFPERALRQKQLKNDNVMPMQKLQGKGS